MLVAAFLDGVDPRGNQISRPGREEVFVIRLILENEGECKRHLALLFFLDRHIFQNKDASRLQSKIILI